MSRTPGLPGPRRPRFLQGLRFLLTEHRMLERYRRRYGELFALDVWPFAPLVIVSDPAEVRRIFTADATLSHAGEGNGILGPLVGPHSVLLLDETEHLRRRKVLLPAFHGERMRLYGDVMREVAAAEVATWPRGEELALLPAMQRITLRIILRTVFGMDEGPRAERLERDLVLLMERSNVMMMHKLQRNLGPRSPWMRFERARETVDGQLYEEIARRREAQARGVEGDDVLSMLLSASDHVSDVELRDDLMTLLVAGHETTATTMAWTLERLLRHPEALRRAQEDVEYLDAAVKETQRVRPVLTYAMRKLTAPMEIHGHTIPAGATLGMSVTLMHRRPDLYPDPHAFRPERWLDGRGRAGTGYGWIPFGGGVRRCLGAAFATYEMREVLGVVLADAPRLRAVTPDRAERHRRKMITFTPDRGTRAVVAA